VERKSGKGCFGVLTTSLIGNTCAFHFKEETENAGRLEEAARVQMILVTLPLGFRVHEIGEIGRISVLSSVPSASLSFPNPEKICLETPPLAFYLVYTLASPKPKGELP
jgi:hypothetical protein